MSNNTKQETKIPGKQFSLWIEGPNFEKVSAMAEEQGRSIAKIINMLINRCS